MNKKHVLLFAILLITVISCRTAGENKTIRFEHSKTLKVSDFISEYKMLKLNPKDEYLIGAIEDIHIYNNKIYILDQSQKHNGIFIYDTTGMYIGRVGNVGAAPHEYITLSCMEISNGKIYTVDNGTHRLIVYDANSYSYIESFKIPFFSNSFKIIEDKIIWYSLDHNNDMIQVTNLKGENIESSYPSIKPPMFIFSVSHYLYNYNDSIYFHHPYTSRMYTYNLAQNICNIAYDLEFEGMKFCSVESLSNKDVMQLKKEGFILYLAVTENDEKLIVRFGDKNDEYIGLLNKTTKEAFFCKKEELIDDLGLTKFRYPEGRYNNYFVSFFAFEVGKKIPDNSILNGIITEDEFEDYPVIVLFK